MEIIHKKINKMNMLKSINVSIFINAWGEPLIKSFLLRLK